MKPWHPCSDDNKEARLRRRLHSRWGDHLTWLSLFQVRPSTDLPVRAFCLLVKLCAVAGGPWSLEVLMIALLT